MKESTGRRLNGTDATETYKDIKSKIKEDISPCDWFDGEGCAECPADGKESRREWMCLDIAKRVHAADKRKHRAELKDARDARDIAIKEARCKRELTDEAREAVKRLRAIDPYDANNEACNALFGEPIPFDMPYGEANRLFIDRICELIEHGGKQDVDGAQKPGTVCKCETHAQDRDTAAAWVEANGGFKKVEEMRVAEVRHLYRINRIARACGVSPRGLNGDAMEEAIMAELDKRKHRAELRYARDARYFARKEANNRKDALERTMVALADAEARVAKCDGKLNMTYYDVRMVVSRLMSIRDHGVNLFSLYESVVGQDVDRISENEWNILIDRLIELIKHSSNQDVDVTALRKLASRIERSADNPIFEECEGEVEDYYTAQLAADARTIRKAVEGAPKRDTGREAAADWVEANGGLDEVKHHYAFIVEQVSKRVSVERANGELEHVTIGKIMAELDERLMPPGMTWPWWSDNLPITRDDAPESVTAVCLALDGSCYSLHYDMPEDERMVHSETGERVKRPEPEVLGADGKPIKVGETVYAAYGWGGAEKVKSITLKPFGQEVHFENGEWDRPEVITHTPPDTRATLAGAMGEELAARVDSLVKSGRWLDE